MIRDALTLLVPCLVCLLAGGCDQRASDKEELQGIFATLDNCCNNSDGVGMLGLYSQSTFDQYEALLPIILDGTPEQIAELPAPYQYEVLMARLKSSRGALGGLTGRQYVAHATTAGWYSIPRGLRTTDTLGGFEFGPDGTAWAGIYTNGQRTGLRMCFVREDGVWKIDEPRQHEASSQAWRATALEKGMTLEEFVLQALSVDENRPIAEGIWEPMGQGAMAGVGGG